MKKKILTRAVWLLAGISFFADLSSEMLYPVMPVYLKSIGFSMVLIGLLEGVAEAVAGIGKGYFGKYSDHLGVRVPFVRLGYLASAVTKPLFALGTSVWWVFGLRTLDRIGKGLRTGARDAMLSDASTPETKAQVFGFHRSMDTFGAVIGPAVALCFLYFYPEQYIWLFLLAAIPGVCSVAITFLLKDRKRTEKSTTAAPSALSLFTYWKGSPKIYKKITIGLLAFTFFNSSDVFLLLKMKYSGMDDTGVIGLYIFYNLVYALLSYPIGIIADKIGTKRVLLTGLLFFSICYALFAFNENWIVFVFAFVIYGIYAASTEGIAKAWIANVTEKSVIATAIGTFAGLQSIVALFSSFFAGLMWHLFGAAVPFIVAAIGTLGVVVYLHMMTTNDLNPK